MASHKDFFFKKAVSATNYISENIISRLTRQQQELEEKGILHSLEELAVQENIITEEELQVINKQIQKEMNIGVTRELPSVDRRMRATNKQFLHYEILEEIESSSLGRVYKVRNTKNDNRVAIKEFSPEENMKLDRYSFFREIEKAKNLDHPYIERIYNIHKDNVPPFLVVELIEGESLDYAKRKGLSSLRAVEIIKKVAQALQYSHQKEIYHRNLTPENIYIDLAGDPIVTEFGIVKEEFLIGGITISGLPRYMSPEQAMGIKKQVDAKSDIFSLGIILYELLTNKLPFEGNNTEEIIESIQNKTPTPPSKINERVSEKLNYICAKSLEKNRDNRYNSVEEMNQDLDLYLQGKLIIPNVDTKRDWQKIVIITIVVVILLFVAFRSIF